MDLKQFSDGLELAGMGFANGKAPGYPFTEKEKWAMVEEAVIQEPIILHQPHLVLLTMNLFGKDSSTKISCIYPFINKSKNKS